ncbi:PR domain zinc finger protein 14 [Elephas maximus indicus]|uniref:PR domain zinc finger protein 14 n=1 Tax=Elephas maximus indicus TaxID=99487 RepID=UPI00211652FF|nr:PR domain zinc finger protein 14 [Elephas maximus indicus]
MALRPLCEAGPQDKVYYPPFQSNPEDLAAYYTSSLPYGHYGNTLTTAQEDYQSFRQLDSAVSESQAMLPFAFETAAPLLISRLALQPELLYDLPGYGKVPQWYPIPHLPREVPHFVKSEYTGASSEDFGHIGGQSNTGQCYGPETLIPLPPVDACLLPEDQKTFQLSCIPSKGSEDVPKPLSPEGKSTHYHFTAEDLHLVLYGAIRSLKYPVHLHHAISGLPVPASSSGSNSLPQSLDKDSLQLPEGLCLRWTIFGGVPHFGVFCSSLIAKGVRFGPFQGKVINASEIKTYGDNSLMWEIFEDGQLSHFVDGKGGAGNWMSYVNCARFPEEQNLVAVQCKGQIFYESCKEIYQNQELLVWYGDCYEKFLDIPLRLRFTDQGKPLPGPSEESEEGYRCERCGKVFTYKYYKDKHLKYTSCVDKGDRKFPCSLCNRSFEKRDRLRIHVLHVHEKHRPYKCSTCGKCFSQSSSLNKHMRIHSGERPYQCVYCTKTFTASSILRTHIRQHSGEKPFKCKYCGKCFASHAAHDSHVRRSHKDDDHGFSVSVEKSQIKRLSTAT